MNKKTIYKAILFDLDGVLVDMPGVIMNRLIKHFPFLVQKLRVKNISYILMDCRQVKN